jgi:hypothetical protein
LKPSSADDSGATAAALGWLDGGDAVETDIATRRRAPVVLAAEKGVPTRALDRREQARAVPLSMRGGSHGR